MRITDIQRAFIGYRENSATSRKTGSIEASEPQDIVSASSSGNLTLPDLLRLTSAENPQREAFLTALSESLRAGLVTSDPTAVATSILRKSFTGGGQR